jgi:hypothetical protein
LLVPSSLTAGEILSKAAVAQNPPARFAGNQAAGWTVHQKLRIRVGTRTAIRDLQWAPSGPATQPRWDSELDAANWHSPLSAAGFAAWHEGLKTKTDRIRRWGDRLTLITNSNDTPIVEAALMMRFSDFHHIEQRIAFASGPRSHRPGNRIHDRPGKGAASERWNQFITDFGAGRPATRSDSAERCQSQSG